MIHRVLTEGLLTALGRFPVVGLIGSRQAGKTTLAKQLAAELGERAVYLDLELPSDLAKLSDPEVYLDGHGHRLVILDEIHRTPELFVVLRALVDKARRPGRFLVLGSASPELLRQGSQSLAGRITFLELPPFLLAEVREAGLPGESPIIDLWLRGGYPESLLAESAEASLDWRDAFIRTVLERDFPQLGLRVSATRMRRFFQMLAHVQGQVWNASLFARNFDVTAPTVRHYLDLLTDTFLVRQLQPLHVNLKKRLVKSPKVYIRDCGLLHVLLRIQGLEELHGHPALGASFESFAVEQIIQTVPARWDATFFRTHTGDELDLVLDTGAGRKIAVEVKYTAAPKLGKGFRRALQDVGASHGYVVSMGKDAFPLAKNVEAVPLESFLLETVPRLAGVKGRAE